ncbi:MAG: competence protein ComK [Erysipelotrichaceae bacterium]|nr:competence protein ComK [Erysipelotrichaceae bacterium]
MTIYSISYKNKDYSLSVNQRMFQYQRLKRYLESLCIVNGSSLKGGIESYRRITGYKNKPCIYIDEGLMLMPDSSLNADSVNLINYFQIDQIRPIDDFKTRIIYKNGSEQVFDNNHRIYKKQQLRCREYLKKILK